MSENCQLVATPHRIFGIREIFEEILSQSLDLPTPPYKHVDFMLFAEFQTKKAIVDLSKLQRVCKYWHVFIQSSNYLQKKIGMKHTVVDSSFTTWNPVLFDSYESATLHKARGPDRIIQILRPKYTMAVAFLVLQQLPRERHFLHQLENESLDRYFIEGTQVNELLPFLQPESSWRSLAVPIGEGEFVLSVRKSSSSIRCLDDLPV